MNTKPFYQLTTKNGIPTFYLFFDNMDLNDRLIIKVMIYRCNIKEYNRRYLKLGYGIHHLTVNLLGLLCYYSS